MNKLRLTLLAPLLIAAGRETDPAAERLRADVAYLADDLFEGRAVGTPGHELAARFVATRLAALGVRPAGEDGWFQRLRLAESRFTAPPTLSIALPDGPMVLAQGRDAVIAPGDRAGAETVTAPLVFAGYGIKDARLGIDDYAGLNVAGKIVVALVGAPPALDSETAAHLGRFKARSAHDLGARGLILVRTLADAERLPWARLAGRAGSPRRMLLDDAGRPRGDGAGLAVRATLSDEAAARLFRAAGQDFATVRAAAERGPVKGFALPGTATLTREQTVTTITTPNVVGVLPGRDPRLAGQYVVMMAHTDHIGVKADAAPGADRVYNGAQDNASGVAVLLEAARTLAARPPRRSVLFVATTAEESGLLGAEHFAARPTVPLAAISAVVNLDMPILLCDFGSVVPFGAARTTMLPVVAAAARAEGAVIGADPQPAEAVFTRSDHYALVRAGVPSLFLKTGWERPRADAPGCRDAERKYRLTDYHEVSDGIDLPFDWAAAARFSRITTGVLRGLADAPRPVAWKTGDYFGESFRPAASPPRR